MRAGSYLLAGLALGALSFNPALARRHGHAGHYSSYHRAERGVQKGADSSTVVAPDVKDGQRTGDVDKSSDKSQDSDAHRGPNKLDKAGVSPKDHASEPEAQPSIDTRITVHQGREPLKGPHLRQFGQFKGEQSRFADAPGSKPAPLPQRCATRPVWQCHRQLDPTSTPPLQRASDASPG
jgi:hypothetical protein